MKKIIWCILVFIASYINANENILYVTDIHFNPYALCKQAPCTILSQLIESDIKYWPQILADDNAIDYKIENSNGFLQQGLSNLAPYIKQEKIKNTILTGDILSHNFDKQYYKYAPDRYNNQEGLTNFSFKTSAFVLASLEQATNNSKIFYILGNNDGDNEDYITPSKAFLAKLAEDISQNMTPSQKAQFIKDFTLNGYFVSSLSDKVDVIGINTDLLSRIHPYPDFAMAQLKWLSRTLEKSQAKHKHVIIIQHIPYGVDTYKTASIKFDVMSLDPKLQEQYLKVINRYKDTISSIYAGHYHADYFILLPDSNIPVVSTIAFNTLFGNNPGFKILEINDNGYLVDYTTYTSDVSKDHALKWSMEYQLSIAYPESNISQIIKNMPKDLSNSQVVNYRNFYNGGSSIYQPISIDINWKYYYCAMQNVTEVTYDNCLDKF